MGFSERLVQVRRPARVAGVSCPIAHVASRPKPRQCIDDPSAAADSAAQSAIRVEAARAEAARERAAESRRAAVQLQAKQQVKVLPGPLACIDVPSIAFVLRVFYFLPTNPG
jgi:hypothetical protein